MSRNATVCGFRWRESPQPDEVEAHRRQSGVVDYAIRECVLPRHHDGAHADPADGAHRDRGRS